MSRTEPTAKYKSGQDGNSVGVVANEFFDNAVGSMGGFGWVAREAALCLGRASGGTRGAVYLAGSTPPSPLLQETQSFGIPLVFAQENWHRYLDSVRQYDCDVLLSSHFHGIGSWEPKEIPANVRFTGHVEGEEKRRLLASAWVLVNTSIHEALPVSFLESLHFEMPIVSCQNPEELVSKFGSYTGRWDGSGLDGLPSFHEGLARLLDDSDLRMSLGKAGKAWASKYHGRANFLSSYRQLRTGIGVDFDNLKRSLNYKSNARSTWPEPWGLPGWLHRSQQAAREIIAVVPEGESISLADQCELGDHPVPERHLTPFPEDGGQYSGPPVDDAEATQKLEQARASGTTFLVVAWTAFWWLDHYSKFAAFLAATFQCVLRTEQVVIYDLRSDRSAGKL